MGIRDMLRKTGLKMLENLRRFFGRVTFPKSSEVRQEILLRLRDEISTEKGIKVFPFRIISVQLQPHTKQALQEYGAGLVENSSLESEIISMFRSSGVQSPADMKISVELHYNFSQGGALFKLECLEPVTATEPEIPELHLQVLKGNAERKEYRLVKERLLVGCLPEVQDLEGRLVRKNNIVFPHEGSEINATVGTMHARIWFDSKIQEFRIMDESSRYGTRIVREGQTIEVPSENMRGIGLRAGDEIYFGQACLRFMPVRDTE